MSAKSTRDVIYEYSTHAEGSGFVYHINAVTSAHGQATILAETHSKAHARHIVELMNKGGAL